MTPVASTQRLAADVCAAQFTLNSRTWVRRGLDMPRDQSAGGAVIPTTVV